MSSATAKDREALASERSSTPKRLPEDLFAWEKPLKPAKRARVTPTDDEPPQSFSGPSFQLTSRDDPPDVDMHSDAESDSDASEDNLNDDSNYYVHNQDTHAAAKDGKAAKILGADLPSAGDKYGWVEELFITENVDGEGKRGKEEFDQLVIELDSSDEEAIGILTCATSTMTI
ncbi:unnamed protein product [Peniophora sp. CBMAI 1063]|nr:unnamed protein product [Peniophora sp. CBMAI 1063]